MFRDINRATRKHYSLEKKIRVALDGLRGEDSIAEFCRLEGILKGIITNSRRILCKLASGSLQAIMPVPPTLKRSRTYGVRLVI